MGVTQYDIKMLETLINQYDIKSVIELGSQQQYTEENYGRYMSEWYGGKGISYLCIDLNQENNAISVDLSKSLELNYVADLVTDFGTSEHVSDHGLNYDEALFSWEAIYNCWFTKFKLCDFYGWIASENPKTGNWPKHGVNYYTKQFYIDLANHSGLTILSLDEVAAMGNETDGWNIVCIMRKITNHFPTLEEFKKFDLRTS